MTIKKLFSKKDETGLLSFIKQVQDLEKYIAQNLGKNKEVTLKEVMVIIDNIKVIHKAGEELKVTLEAISKDKPKKYLFQLNILKDKMAFIENLYIKVIKYESQLKEYQLLKETEPKIIKETKEKKKIKNLEKQAREKDD